MIIQRKYHYRAAGFLLILCAILFVVVSPSEFIHKIAGLPHWTVDCPRDAVGILVIGQSHASNTGPLRHISFTGSRAFADGKCYYLRDPMPGTGGRGGTIWPIFADRLGKRVAIADIAISGSAIGQWTTPEQIAKIRKTLAQLRTAGFPKPLIIWMQGETDAARRTSSEAYYSQLHMLLQIAPDNRWLITRESICYDLQKKWVPLDVARDKMARDFRAITVGPDLDTIGIAFRQGDRCHLTSAGQAALATDLAAAAEPLLAR